MTSTTNDHELYGYLVDRPLKLNPRIMAIRNKRKRMRLVKKMARRGIETYKAPHWERTPRKGTIE